MVTPPNEACAQCRLRRLPAFARNTAEQVACIQRLKIGELAFPAGQTVLREGQAAERVFTLLVGWAFRYKTLPDGRRLILNFLLPGDLVGLQAKLFSESGTGIETLTDTILCAFSRNRIWDIYRTFPELAYDMTWLCAHEERMVDDALLSVGRRSAQQAVAWLIVHLWERATGLSLVQNGALRLPITQVHLADALGLSIVHANRTVQALRRRKLFEWAGGTLRAVDIPGLRRLARYSEEAGQIRPLF